MLAPYKAPAALLVPPHSERYLTLQDDVQVVEACTHFQEKRGAMYLQDHLLLFVLVGTYHIYHGGQYYRVNSGEMVLLQRATQFEYHKLGNPDQDFTFDCLMFFLRDDFVKEFAQRASPALPPDNVRVPVSVQPISDTLAGFLESIKPYFAQPSSIDGGLLRLKMQELLYGLASHSPGLLHQLLQLSKPLRADIPPLMEANLTTGATLSDLAYLSGRSLSTFKREFQTIYHMAPAQWLREHRMEKARTLLQSTGASVTEVAHTLGFESLAHFSRLFKQQFGYSPSTHKKDEQKSLLA
jgi:AraC-like DNA-binding protein